MHTCFGAPHDLGQVSLDSLLSIAYAFVFGENAQHKLVDAFEERNGLSMFMAIICSKLRKAGGRSFLGAFVGDGVSNVIMLFGVSGCDACLDVGRGGMGFDPCEGNGCASFGADGFVEGFPQVTILLECPCFTRGMIFSCEHVVASGDYSFGVRGKVGGRVRGDCEDGSSKLWSGWAASLASQSTMQLSTQGLGVGGQVAELEFGGVGGKNEGVSSRPPYTITTEGPIMVSGEGVSAICPDIRLGRYNM
jgi:hypothetical protein